MNKDKFEYRKYAAFIDRERELQFLKSYMDEEPESILSLHGPKSSGKTTLLYKFLNQIQKEQKLDVKFLDLREAFTNVYEDFFKSFFHVETRGEKRNRWHPMLIPVFSRSMLRWKGKSWKSGPIPSKS